jgi:hypothetical protein
VIEPVEVVEAEHIDKIVQSNLSLLREKNGLGLTNSSAVGGELFLVE